VAAVGVASVFFRLMSLPLALVSFRPLLVASY
jgi:hypothetical protein